MPAGTLTLASFSGSLIGFATAFGLAAAAKVVQLAQISVPEWLENTFAGLFIAALVYAVVALWRELKIARQDHVDALESRLENQDAKIANLELKTTRIEDTFNGG